MGPVLKERLGQAPRWKELGWEDGGWVADVHKAKCMAQAAV